METIFHGEVNTIPTLYDPYLIILYQIARSSNSFQWKQSAIYGSKDLTSGQ